MSPILQRTRVSRAALTAAVSTALVLGTTGPALAATNTLTITAVNRNGAKVAVAATVINLASSQSYQVRTGTKRKLPKGSYAVLASINTGSTTTLGGRTVKVAGAARTTIDARQGRLVRLGISPAVPGIQPYVSAQICSRTGNSADAEVEAEIGEGRTLYAIPTASKKIAFAAMSTWTDRTGSSDTYVGLHRTTGVPANPSRTFTRSKLAAVTIDSRRGPTGTPYSGVAVQPDHQGCGRDMWSGLWSGDQPTTAKVYISPGKWTVRGDLYAGKTTGETISIGDFSAGRTFAAGRSHLVRFFGAAWGPGIYLPMTTYGRIAYPIDDMFRDPAFNDIGGQFGSGPGGRAKATLRFGGKVVKTASTTGYGQYLPTLRYKVKKAGWYTLTNTAKRYHPDITFPAGLLSTASTVTFRFQAKPNTSVLSQVNSVQQVPAGLDRYNQAKAGGTTNVTLKLSRHLIWGDVKKGTGPKLKSLTTRASFDGGRTWRTVPVRKIGGSWTAVVRNPASGAVSLRTRATYTSGGYTEATIIRAYAIG